MLCKSAMLEQCRVLRLSPWRAQGVLALSSASSGHPSLKGCGLNMHLACDAGGLGDVMGALPKALARRGHRVMVVVPRYSNYEEGWETGVRARFRVMGSDTEVALCLACLKAVPDS